MARNLPTLWQRNRPSLWQRNRPTLWQRNRPTPCERGTLFSSLSLWDQYNFDGLSNPSEQKIRQKKIGGPIHYYYFISLFSKIVNRKQNWERKNEIMNRKQNCEDNYISAIIKLWRNMYRKYHYQDRYHSLWSFVEIIINTNNSMKLLKLWSERHLFYFQLK